MKRPDVFNKHLNKIYATHAFIISLLCVNCWALPIDDESDYFDCGIADESIYRYQLCDGEAHCPNAADELRCRDTKCPPYTYKCRYGACIPYNALCNGNKNCIDGSDESSFICGRCFEESQIKCESGACIEKWQLCDGHQDCSDGSDELEALCRFDTCTMEQFRCNYGACIDKERRCNGHDDCADGSDERGCTRDQTKRPKTRINLMPDGAAAGEEEACEIPLNHTNLRAHSRNQNAELQPGSKVGASTRVRFWCATNALMLGDYDEVLCTSRGWQFAIPSCIVLCDESTLRRSISTVVSCENKHGQSIDCTRIMPGTIAKFQCAISYRLPHPEWSVLMSRTCQHNGEWSGEAEKCVPVCGTAETAVSDNAAGLPWHVGIYSSADTKNENEFRRICGGTIITTKLVITAAHCFEKIDSELFDVEYFRVFAGQIERNITRILTQSYDAYHYDIALLRLDVPFVYNGVISPICLDWAAQGFDEHATPPINIFTAYIVSWNVAAGNDGAKRYRRIEVTATSHAQCKTTPTITALAGGGYQLHDDKFCIEPSKRYQTAAAAAVPQICPGDSGAGVFVRIKNAYHLIGIVSHAPSRQLDCTTGLVTVTEIKDIPQTLKQFIKDKSNEE